MTVGIAGNFTLSVFPGDVRLHFVIISLCSVDSFGNTRKAKTQIETIVVGAHFIVTECTRSSDPFYIVTSYIKWVTTSWSGGS